MTAPVHEKDIAAIVVAASGDADSGPVGAVLTGPERISQRDQVAAIAAAIGRPRAVIGRGGARASASSPP
ncbi:hypothetical protein [Amnibacterium kyonggiense]